MSTDLLTRARAGDEHAFRELVEPHRRELQVHCYRMLASLHDAEDALQETMLASWRGLAEFEERSSLRTWLYRIATNRCLNALRSRRRRPPMQDLPVERPEPTGHNEVPWLEPYPDVLLDAGAARAVLTTDARGGHGVADHPAGARSDRAMGRMHGVLRECTARPTRLFRAFCHGHGSKSPT